MSHRHFTGLVVTFVFAVLVAGCGDPGGMHPTPPPPVPTPQPKAVVAGTLEVTQTRTGDKVSYVFAVKLTESKGVPATVTDAWVNFDGGWSGQCMFDVRRLGQTRVPANGTLALDPLTCVIFNDNNTVFGTDLNFFLMDDNGNWSSLVLLWNGMP